METFKGFTDSETFTQLPDSFFHHLLNEISDADELKVTLYALWRIEHMDGPFRALRETDFDVEDLDLTSEEIRSGLEKAVKRNSLLKRSPATEGSVEGSQHEAGVFYFLNSPRGRAAAEAFAKGQWPEPVRIPPSPPERPNVFRLYEENIGPLTPLIADFLKDAEKTYPEEWLADAIELAVKRNERRWTYIEGILKRWKEEGRAEKQNRRDDKGLRRNDIQRKVDKFFKR